jgi:hypothetical protein
MTYEDVTAVCSEKQKKTEAMCWQNVEFWVLNRVVQETTTRL